METETKPEVAKSSPAELPLTVHIDTSLQIEQQKAEVKAGPVRRALSQYKFTSTSSYARKEFKRAWLKDLGLCYKATRDAKQIGDVFENIRKSTYHAAAKRRLDRCISAANAFLSANPSLPSDVAVIRLRSHLGESILGGFTKWGRSVTHEYDGTRCFRATERPTRASDGSIDVSVRQCKPSRIQCSVHEFFRQHEAVFSRIKAEIQSAESSASEELKGTAMMIDKAIRDSEILCDDKNCSSMSDAIIAVDGLNSSHFAANNDKEWRTLARVLGKTLVNPVSGETFETG